MHHGLNVKVLARSPRKVAKHFPYADVLQGNMMNVSDVKEAFNRLSAAFLITPVGGNDDVQIELRAAFCAITEARATASETALILMVPPWAANIESKRWPVLLSSSYTFLVEVMKPLLNGVDPG
jgi:uncharacterized protein YbjT (DUF2867 family)